MLKKFFIWMVKSLIMLVIVTLIFSTITLNFPNFLKGVFGDIFEYASPDAQNQVIGKIAETCSSLDKGQPIVILSQICSNSSLLLSMQENCENYRELKKINVRIENEEQVIKSCEQIESGELEMTCGKVKQKNSLSPDLGVIGALCKDYKNGKINDREFFIGVVSSPFGNQQIESQNMGVLKNYNRLMTYLNSNKVIYVVIFSILALVLYLLINDAALFLIMLGEISFGIGMIIMLPYIAILVYDKLISIDTTSILGGIFGDAAGFEPKAIISAILLLFLRTYSSFVIILGSVFLSIGIGSRVYRYIFKKEGKDSNNKKKQQR